MDLNDIIVELFKHGMIKFGEFTLTSGKKSPYYIDLRILPSYVDLYNKLMSILVEYIRELNILFDMVAGIETAGIVHATYIGCLLNKPIAYVRKKRKEHGTQRLVEGIVNNKTILLIDDVATTGSSLEYGITILRQHGAFVRDVIVIVDRLEGARDRLDKLGVRLHSLMDAYKIINVLLENNLIDRKVYDTVINYINTT